MRDRIIRWGLTAAAVSAAAALAACSSSGGGSASTTGGSSTPAGTSSSPNTATSPLASEDTGSLFVPPTSLPVTTPISKPIPSGLKVVFLSSGVSQALLYLKGVQAAAAVLGWTVENQHYDQTNPASFTSALQSAIAEKPAAIIMNSVVREQYAAQIPSAVAAKIVLIPSVTNVPAEPGVYPAVLTKVESTYAAHALADALVADAKQHNKTAHVLQITVPAFATVLGVEDQGVKEEMAAKCPSCTQSLININLPDVFNGKYVQQVVSYLQAHPDINYIVSDSGQLETGLGPALSQAGLNSLTRYGFSPSNVQIKELQGGQSGAWAVQPYQEGGWQMIDVIARALVGDPTNVWDDEHLVYLLNSSNAKDVDPNDPEFPANYPDQFKKLWGK